MVRIGALNNITSKVPSGSSPDQLGRAVRMLLRGVEDTGHVTIEHRLTNLLFLLFSSFFYPLVPFCFASTVSSTPSRSQKPVNANPGLKVNRIIFACMKMFFTACLYS